MTQDMRKQDALDAILHGEEALVPSSGFLASVMERVQEEAAAPAPIPFPWHRVLPGIILAALSFGWILVLVLRHLPQIVASLSAPEAPFSMTLTKPMQDVAWILLALGISLASWLFSRRIAGRSGLL